MFEVLLDLTPYFILVLLLLAPIITNNRGRENIHYFIFCCFLISSFSAFRYGVGWDYFNYYNGIYANDWRVDRMEPLMRWLAVFSHNINYPQLFMIVTSIATVFLYARVIDRKSLSPITSLLVYLCCPFLFLGGMSIVRFALAVAVVFYASLYYKKPLVYLLLIILAFLIHRSAILGLLVWPFLGVIKIGLKANWAICIMGIIASFLPSVMAPLFSNVLSFFSEVTFLEDTVSAANKYLEVVSGEGFTRLPYVYAIINIVNLSCYNEFKRRNPNSDITILITLYNIGTSLMLFLTFDSVFASRLGQMFLVYIVLIVPYYLTIRSNTLYWVISAIIVALFFVQLSIPGHHEDFIGRWNCFLPYQTIFN